MPLPMMLDRNTFAPIALYEDFITLKWTRNLMVPSSFEMVINRFQFNAKFLSIGQLFAVSETVDRPDFDHVFLIEQIENFANETAEDELITISGRGIGGFFEERLIIPNSGNDFDTANGNAESLIKYYVNKHVAFGAPLNRRIPNLFVKTDLGRGSNFTFTGRYQTVKEGIEEIGFNNTPEIMGWDIELDLNTNTFQFDVILGEDHTEGSPNPVYFDFEFESIMQLRWFQSILDKKTVALVGGKGEGDLRVIETVFIGAEPTGFDRKEIFIDSEDLDTTLALQIKGVSTLLSTIQDNTIELKVNRIGPFQYRRDWDLGDNITVRNKFWNLKEDLKIISITNELKAGSPQTDITVELERKFPDIKGRINELFNTREAGGRR